MVDSNVPKFLKDDLPLFNALVKDLFPKTKVPKIQYDELQGAIENGFRFFGLEVVDVQIVKIIQLFETFNVRFGVMIVGFTGSAKTACYEILKYAMTELRAKESKDKRF